MLPLLKILIFVGLRHVDGKWRIDHSSLDGPPAVDHQRGACDQ
jgi:hypothetical protein